MADVKVEVKPEIKADPDASPGKMDVDADQYEEDFDTYVPPKDDPGQSWLVRIPADLWGAWQTLYNDANEDEYIEIGKLKVFENSQDIQVTLDPNFEPHQAISKAYNLNVKSHEYKNSVVFSEKERKNQPPSQPSRYQTGSRPTGVQSKWNRYGNSYGSKKTGDYRSSIPKQTALAPPIANEATAVAVDDMADFMKAYQAALKPKNATVYEAHINRSQHPGLAQDLAFAFTSKPSKATKKKKENKDKAVRMEKGALFDEIAKCFERYKYWSLKALRNELKQPEAYIKEALDDVAILVRSGDFAMNYKLKPEYEKAKISDQNAVKDEVAPSVKDEDETDQGTGDELGSDDDDPMDFEEVKLEGNAQGS